jgi:hypothetical protein
MAIQSRGARGLDYASFLTRLEGEGLSDKQNGPLRQRLNLLESFMERNKRGYVPLGERSAETSTEDAWRFAPGTLTIVDLSCPFVDENAACALFAICLELFLENRGDVGRIIALDEAHKVSCRQPLQWLDSRHLARPAKRQRK